MGLWFCDRLRLNFKEILGKLNGRPALVALQTTSKNNVTLLSQLIIIQLQKKCTDCYEFKELFSKQLQYTVMKGTKTVHVITTYRTW